MTSELDDSDVTAAPPPDPRVARLTLLLTALVEMGRVFGRTEDRALLFGHACRLAVEVAGFRAAWIGMLDGAGATHALIPVASAGPVQSILPGLRIQLDDEPAGYGVVSTAMHEQRTVVVNDALSDPLMARWRDEVRACGYGSVLAVPVVVRDTVRGVGLFYSGVPGAFTPEEVGLLERVMGDLGFRLEVIENEAGRRAAEDRFRVLFEQSTAPIIIDRDHRILYANPAAAALFRFGSAADAVGRHLDEMHAPLDRARHTPDSPACLFEGGRQVADTRFLRADGSALHARLNAAPIDLPDGPALAVFVTDLTDQVAAREHLRHSEQRYRHLVEQASDPIFIADRSGRFVEVNDAACALLGYERAELLRRNISELVPPEARARQAATLKRLTAGETVMGEWTLIRRDGTLIATELSARQLPDGRMHAIVRDITKRKDAEAERDRLAAVVDQMTDSVLVLDLAGRIVYANPAFTTLSGHPVSQAIGQRPPALLRPTTQSVELSIAIDAASRDGTSWTGRLPARRADDATTDVDLSIVPLRDEDGRLIGSIEIARDVSREVALEAQLRQAQKLEAIGRLAGGIAHDFNNQLTAITGFAGLVAASLPATAPAHADLREITRAADRAIDLTRQMLAFSRKQVLEPRPLHLPGVIAGVTPMLGRLLGENVRLVVRISETVGPAFADHGQLEQVIVNLAVNARDAMPGGGVVTIDAADADLDESFALTHPGTTPGSYVLLAVSDTGMGMSADVMEHAFDPFFTTKPAGAGTGLGLAMVFGIVKQSGGQVFAYSEPGRGATFKVYLPRVEAVVVAEQTVQPAKAPPGGSETILVVEDEEAVRMFAARVLSTRGYRVLTASNGAEAIEMAAAYAGPIHLVFTDVVMPGLGGVEVARQIGRARPATRVLCTSGYAEGGAVEAHILDPGIPFLGKPYAANGLLARVRTILDLRTAAGA